MILIDWNQVSISNLMSQINSNPNATVDDNLVRHMVLSSILYYKNKFGEKYGDIVICCDDKNYWRRDVFPYYKGNRKSAREKSDFDWNLIFTTLNALRDEIKKYFPYKIIRVKTAEADDIIATLAENSQNDFPLEPLLILSGDKDFRQLQIYPNVRQYSPMQKRFIIEDHPKEYLREHIIRGDSGDGVPNILSADDVFMVPNKRQSPLSKKRFNYLYNTDPEEYEEPQKTNYARNRDVIDLKLVPQDIKDKILSQFAEEPKGKRRDLLSYFIKNRLKYLTEHLGEF